MINFAVNISTIFTEASFLDRFKKVKDAGFSYVECQFPYQHDVEAIKRELDDNQLKMVLINLPPGNLQKGDRGVAIDPNRKDEFKDAVSAGITYATHLSVSKIHCMAGVIHSHLLKKAKDVYIENLKYAANLMANHNITLMIEPINRFDIPNYFLSNIDQAIEIIEEVNLPNVKLQFDFYHTQLTQGNLINTFQQSLKYIGHVQIADVPARHEPETGEINYRGVLDFVERSKYEGIVGLEYHPKGKSEDSFKWMEFLKYGDRPW